MHSNKVNSRCQLHEGSINPNAPLTFDHENLITLHPWFQVDVCGKLEEIPSRRFWNITVTRMGRTDVTDPKTLFHVGDWKGVTEELHSKAKLWVITWRSTVWQKLWLSNLATVNDLFQINYSFLFFLILHEKLKSKVELCRAEQLSTEVFQLSLVWPISKHQFTLRAVVKKKILRHGNDDFEAETTHINPKKDGWQIQTATDVNGDRANRKYNRHYFKMLPSKHKHFF